AHTTPIPTMHANGENNGKTEDDNQGPPVEAREGSKTEPTATECRASPAEDVGFLPAGLVHCDRYSLLLLDDRSLGEPRHLRRDTRDGQKGSMQCRAECCLTTGPTPR